jgi:DNA-binding transcriptional MerR regulator
MSPPIEGSVKHFEELGFTAEEAKSLAKRWRFQRPSDPQVDLREAQRGHRIEHRMRELLMLWRTGQITDDEYYSQMEQITGGGR